MNYVLNMLLHKYVGLGYMLNLSYFMAVDPGQVSELQSDLLLSLLRVYLFIFFLKKFYLIFFFSMIFDFQWPVTFVK